MSRSAAPRSPESRPPFPGPKDPGRRSPGRSLLHRAVHAGTVVALASACGDAPDARPADAERPATSIVEVAQAAGQFSALLRAAEAAGLAETLAQDGPFTVFAPTDGAFAALPAGLLDELMEDPEALADVLLYHVVPGRYAAAELRELSELETAQGGTLQLEVTRDGLTVNGVYLLTSDVPAANGIIHVVTAVITP